MAAGDVINSNRLGDNAWFYFQPAAGVEIMITSLHIAGAAQNAGLTSDSINESYAETSAVGGASLNVKIGVTNTNYLNIYGSDSVGYSGIQTK